jgi:integrase
VDLERRELTFPAGNTKDGEERVVPITDRLAAVMDMARVGPEGKPFGPDAFVFGNEVGEAIKSMKTAWGNTCRKAGIEDLHFHDLRHEAGSRWIEGGVPIHHVQALLGHSNVKQTSTYLNVNLEGLKDSMLKFQRSRQVCTKVAQTPSFGPAAPFLGNDATGDKPPTN